MQRITFEMRHSMHGAAKVIVEAYEENGAKVCGIYKIKGRLKLPPKLWLIAVRGTLAELERRAKALGFDEVRMSGRNWVRVFPEYERIEGDAPNLFGKKL